jgi:hypothetical protein
MNNDQQIENTEADQTDSPKPKRLCVRKAPSTTTAERTQTNYFPLFNRPTKMSDQIKSWTPLTPVPPHLNAEKGVIRSRMS